MQISFDSRAIRMAEIVMIRGILDDLAEQLVISPDDNPETGRELTIAELAAQALARSARPAVPVIPPPIAPPPSTPDALPDPAAVFGGAAPAVPLVPPPPIAAPAVASTPISAPVAPPASAPQVGGPVIDAEGLTWDNRIHSTPATVNASDGKWRAKRGLNNSPMVEVVKAEIRKVLALPGPNGAAPAPAPAPAMALVPPPPAPPPVPMIPPPPAGPPMPVAAVASMSFPQFMMALAPILASGKLNGQILQEVLNKNGFPNLPSLSTREDLVPGIYAELQGRQLP